MEEAQERALKVPGPPQHGKDTLPTGSPTAPPGGAGIVRQLRWQRGRGSKPSLGILGTGWGGLWHFQQALEASVASGPGLTSELMLSALGFMRMTVSRISLWWQRVLWPEGEMQEFVLREVGRD